MDLRNANAHRYSVNHIKLFLSLITRLVM